MRETFHGSATPMVSASAISPIPTAAAVDAGVDVLDASVGGLGGCPFAPAATGNIATEDLVYMLSRAGFETGLDLDALIDTGRWISQVLGKAPPSALDRAGVFPAKVEA
jgi:hydroxymethylglutaryl-CoA lyase